jgi:hypothetical protein
MPAILLFDPLLFDPALFDTGFLDAILAPDSSDIDNALLAKLNADVTLAALLPDGWYMDEAQPGLTRFGIVSVVDALDEPMFNGRAWEDILYTVESRILTTPANVATVSGTSKAAAARIDALLEFGDLTIAGYGLMVMRRVGRVRMTEVDAIDRSIRWARRGGRYQVMVAPVLTT